SEWTCPMHPEIVRAKPGSCPICGMALEPKTVDVADGENPELIDMRRRFWVSAAFTLPLFVIAMAELLPFAWSRAFAMWIGRPWIELALAAPVIAWGGWPFFVRGYQSVVNRHLNMFTLIALGVAAATSYSIVMTVRAQDGMAQIYFESAAVIVTLVLL